MAQTVQQLVRDAGSGEGGAREIRAAARLMSMLENEPQRLPELFRGTPLKQWPQPRLVLGITGAPGSGKSTLTDQLIASYRQRMPDGKIGVIAVDPSSPFTGGAVLGDRVRMMRHATDPNVFVRSLASRGHLGGLSLGVKGVLRVMALNGCDTVIIETVGVGQSEVEVAGVADVVMVVLAPGQGDSIQMLKAGLMEIGDLFVINKADREGASNLYSTLLGALSLERTDDLLDARHHGAALSEEPSDAELEDAVLARKRPEKPDVFLVSAAERTGIEELVEGLETRAEKSRVRWEAQRDASVLNDVRDSVIEEARRVFVALLNKDGDKDLHRVLEGDLSVSKLAQALIDRAAAGGHPVQ